MCLIPAVVTGTSTRGSGEKKHTGTHPHLSHSSSSNHEEANDDIKLELEGVTWELGARRVAQAPSAKQRKHIAAEFSLDVLIHWNTMISM